MVFVVHFAVARASSGRLNMLPWVMFPVAVDLNQQRSVHSTHLSVKVEQSAQQTLRNNRLLQNCLSISLDTHGNTKQKINTFFFLLHNGHFFLLMLSKKITGTVNIEKLEFSMICKNRTKEKLIFDLLFIGANYH